MIDCDSICWLLGSSNLHHPCSTFDLARVSIHLRRVDHQASLVTSGASHDPFPQQRMQTVSKYHGNIDPRVGWEQVPNKAVLRPG